jgi:flagellar protein FliT
MTRTLLDDYRDIEHTSREMLSAARRQAWSEVARLEATSREQIAGLQKHAGTPALPPEEQRQKHHLLLAILRHDAQVRSLADPGVAGVDLLFHRSGPSQLH